MKSTVIHFLILHSHLPQLYAFSCFKSSGAIVNIIQYCHSLDTKLFWISQTVDIDFPNTAESYRLYSQVCDFTVIYLFRRNATRTPSFYSPNLMPRDPALCLSFNQFLALLFWCMRIWGAVLLPYVGPSTKLGRRSELSLTMLTKRILKDFIPFTQEKRFAPLDCDSKRL